MNQVKIEFTFDDAKLEAVNIFLNEKNSTLIKELEEFMDTLYKKQVPQTVREFIEKKESAAAEFKTDKKQSRKKMPGGFDAVSGDNGTERVNDTGKPEKRAVSGSEGSAGVTEKK